MAPGPDTPRVLVADDSTVMRSMIADLLRAQGMDVVDEVPDGAAAIARARALKPDVMTLDLTMPGIDGLAVLRALAGEHLETRIVVVSSFSTTLVERALDVLEHGAADIVRKPGPGTSFGEFQKDLVAKVQAAVGAHVIADDEDSATPTVAPRLAGVRSDRILVIASSTGGPRALSHIVPQLPSPLGAGGCIVQHMPVGFTEGFAARLDRDAHLKVREVRAGDRFDPGTLLVARSGQHLRFGASRAATLSDDPPVGGVRPRADLTIHDLARRYGDRVVLAVLTGMGRDGTVGAQAVREAGGSIIAQAEQECVVYGMPRSVVEAGLADQVVHLADMAAAIAETMAGRVAAT